ncbi:hypothetical protein BJI67_06945 [Acidihalobacter aeolianus]|uniref:Methyltransferase domain-containing protein n=2 Tax=Acidihalobacter aeolianus TaxID=2792603 RepID=A0A1D8K7B8_9GAMM|nr:hypothetical protein BJI67_06945 [Acidihalobacter aeolianus]
MEYIMGRSSNDATDRTHEQIREHYEIEKDLAKQLMGASKSERRHLYASLYDELYKRVSHHPQLIRKTSPAETQRAIDRQLKFLSQFLTKDSIFVEVGAGDCALSFEVAKQVKWVYAIDVSEEVTRSEDSPPNFQLILSDGCSILNTSIKANVIYSNQLMEHLHPDDALEQLNNIYGALNAGGCYVCVTPNRLTGPHDISMYFDNVASGFHLKEYSISELTSLFLNVGFTRVDLYALIKGRQIKIPIRMIYIVEKVLDAMPTKIGKMMAKSSLFRGILNSRVVGIRQ